MFFQKDKWNQTMEKLILMMIINFLKFIRKNLFQFQIGFLKIKNVNLQCQNTTVNYCEDIHRNTTTIKKTIKMID